MLASGMGSRLSVLCSSGADMGRSPTYQPQTAHSEDADHDDHGSGKLKERRTTSEFAVAHVVLRVAIAAGRREAVEHDFPDGVKAAPGQDSERCGPSRPNRHVGRCSQARTGHRRFSHALILPQ